MWEDSSGSLFHCIIPTQCFLGWELLPLCDQSVICFILAVCPDQDAMPAYVGMRFFWSQCTEQSSAYRESLTGSPVAPSLHVCRYHAEAKRAVSAVDILMDNTAYESVPAGILGNSTFDSSG